MIVSEGFSFTSAEVLGQFPVNSEETLVTLRKINCGTLSKFEFFLSCFLAKTSNKIYTKSEQKKIKKQNKKQLI